MPELFPFYHQAKDRQMPLGDMTTEEKDILAMDWEQMSGMMQYRKRFEDKWHQAAAIYNIIQTAQPTDNVSRVFLGYTRMIIDMSISQMTEGEPDFDFLPVGPSDTSKTIIWKNLMRMVLSRSNYRAHQNIFMVDYHNLGNGCMEVYTDYPMRTLRIPTDNGEFEEVQVRDFRRPSVGLRHVNPFDAWRNPNINDPTHVPSCTDKEVLSWNQFVVNYGRAVTQDGSPRYKNLHFLQRGTHVVVYNFKDEDQDIFRKYAIPFGGDLDGSINDVPTDVANRGVMIFDKPLKIHEIRKNGKTLRSDGLNIPGMTNIRWATFNDQIDLNRQSHSVYGMGLPQQIEGLDMIIQELFNINIDNWRMANTVVLNYQGNDAKSYMDVDANSFYGGELIDGAITPQSLGSVRLNDYPAIQQVIDQFTIPLTGTNYQQIVGDTSRTAFEFAQRIRANNRRAEQKLRKMEDELFKPIGQLLLSGALSELTIEEYEDMTEDQVESALQNIADGRATPNDFKDLTGEEPKRKVQQFIPIEGGKLREDFSKSKKRRLDRNSASNTLIKDPSMKGDISYIPLVKEYVYPASYIESGILPDVVVDSKRMLGDMKAQDVQTFQAASRIVTELDPEGNIVDREKLVSKVLDFADIDPRDVLIAVDRSEKESKIELALKQMENVIAGSQEQQNAQIPNEILPVEETELQAPAAADREPTAPRGLEAIAQGTL